ncbi:MAG: phenylalanine--tRNA ligase subunit beta [Firmicutes bacterium]|nr:phenylalanine--tRNA ligase subunit beta [Bacillota bacterium]
MKVPFKWLKRYIDLDISAMELAERFTLAGLEVESVEEFAAAIEGVVIAKVLEAKPHPASDHISVCRVDSGDAIHTVICGAPNVKSGQTVPFAKIGARLPGGLEIEAKTALGMVSMGMICSQAELGLDSGNQDGIWVLPEDLPLGKDLNQALDLQDNVLNIALTPNRSDCLGLLNCAYEAAALTGLPVIEPVLEYEETGLPIDELLCIEVDDADLCPRYVGRLVRGIKIAPSPLWLQQYLLQAGMRPINNIVDISNFVMLELNQPLHTFDYQKLAQQKIIVRAALPAETMQTLDGKQRVFRGGEVLICDGEKPICIGGIMGGTETEVTVDTVDVLIESACFKPELIRRTARALGLVSEASLRFEKGVDISACDRAAQRAVELMLKYCGGTAACGSIDVGKQNNYPLYQIILEQDKVNCVLGTSYNMDTILQVMNDLSFTVNDIKAHSANISIPSYRKDITLQEDLIEEIARLLGYNNIPATLPCSNAWGSLTKRQWQQERLRDLNVSLGLYETINYTFISPHEAEKMLTVKNHPWMQPLTLANPLSEEQSVMRLSLLPGLLNCARRNISRRNQHLALFELGYIYIPSADNLATGFPQEEAMWGFLLCGATPSSWQTPGQPYDYFYAKGLIEQVVKCFHSGVLEFKPAPPGLYPYLHPGRSALVMLHDKEFGILGELHPRAAANYDLPPATIVAELKQSPLFNKSQEPLSSDLPKYPAMERDIALVGNADIAATDIENTIRKAAGPLLEKLQLFDIYDGPPIIKGQRSLAYSLSFRAIERTLTDAEADAAMKCIISALAKDYDLKQR